MVSPDTAARSNFQQSIDVLNGQPPANTPRIEVNLLPGVQARYSGGGTTLAGQLVVDVLGKPFPQIMREWVLDPLAMKNSTFEQTASCDSGPALPPRLICRMPNRSKASGMCIPN